MSEKQRQKKDGGSANKKRRRMRTAVAERRTPSAPRQGATDRVDKIKYKRGSDGDRTYRGRTASTRRRPRGRRSPPGRACVRVA